jgi:hypothetical protein
LLVLDKQQRVELGRGWGPSFGQQQPYLQVTDSGHSIDNRPK